ncbi:MAG TPA: hypothetical protein VG939_12535 [Caulobacteraceae bacterium]|nr:hypothetical protein [Caulobacteraceae bacterium]
MKLSLTAAALAAGLALPALALPAFALADTASDTAAAVRAADEAFAARAQAVPPAQAFREYMDETDGTQFDGSKPIKGSQAIYEAMGGIQPAHSKLEWTVKEAWGSRGGDFGVTWGVWKSTALNGARPPVTGSYVTVWRKNAKGEWKGLIDIGNPDPSPAPAAAAAPAQ